jgi:hypothetical protein
MALIELNGYAINPEHISFIRPIRVNLSDEGCEVNFQGGGKIEFGRPVRVIATQIREKLIKREQISTAVGPQIKEKTAK